MVQKNIYMTNFVTPKLQQVFFKQHYYKRFHFTGLNPLSPKRVKIFSHSFNDRRRWRLGLEPLYLTHVPLFYLLERFIIYRGQCGRTRCHEPVLKKPGYVNVRPLHVTIFFIGQVA